MFDVVWANPDRELVGQHKARKEREKGRPEPYNTEKQSSTRSVASVETEASSLRSRKPQSFLESIRLKKAKKPRKQDASSISTGSRLSTFSDNNNNAENRDSILPPPSLASSLGRSTLAQFGDGSSSMVIPPIPPLTPMTSPQKSLYSPPTPKSMASTRRRKKKTSPPELQFHQAGNLPQLDSFTSPEIRPLSLQSSATSWNPSDGWDTSTSPAPLRVVKSPKSPMSPININRSLPGTATTSTSPSSTATKPKYAPNSLSTSLSELQREILQMAAADQDTFWQRLTEEWGAWADAALYQELETERKRWLLSALYSINRLPETGVVPDPVAERRILAFFESQATASYVAALHAGVAVYHMAPSPLSSKLLPNIVPLAAKGPISSSSLSAMPHMFSHIHAQPLPVIVSASEIPRVLRHMHHALKPQGTLRLLLIDPAPANAAMGPRLQAWLDEHLMLNLERLFRCTSPTRLFPTWLRDAHFQVGADAKVVCAFPAVFQDDPPMDSTAAPATLDVDRAAALAKDSPNHTLEPTGQTTGPEKGADTLITQTTETQRKEQRLQSLVGQKLWQETWGPYVTAARWWWEDEACREECIRLQTVWEYHIIDAVKKERYISSQL
ncbi:hypothetical protein SEPCBS119000_003609 [Sporothrix epigloea]|uniref:Uncharacterized protein n=1 Tax=Sporothrix epigloea TaxID=1892477 RepID=A0ABP0DMK0_9PEZI